RIAERLQPSGEAERGGIEGLGAVICGRVMYDLSIPYGGDGGPTGDARVPIIVRTHRPLAETFENSVYRTAGTWTRRSRWRARRRVTRTSA
ncbi:MAG TPA: hypothetical protein VEC15_13905, partial [Actinomycetota bacterium]|nr:hypothetical protein [Actinomycetota bacterium]